MDLVQTHGLLVQHIVFIFPKGMTCMQMSEKPAEHARRDAGSASVYSVCSRRAISIPQQRQGFCVGKTISWTSTHVGIEEGSRATAYLRDALTRVGRQPWPACARVQQHQRGETVPDARPPPGREGRGGQAGARASPHLRTPDRRSKANRFRNPPPRDHGSHSWRCQTILWLVQIGAPKLRRRS